MEKQRVNARQYAFFQANKENPKFNLILGKFLSKSITCRNCGNIIHTFEEKETDARIATQIVSDAYEKNCDVAIVVSADSDMIPAVELAKAAGMNVFIYFPPDAKGDGSVWHHFPKCYQTEPSPLVAFWSLGRGAALIVLLKFCYCCAYSVYFVY